MVNEILLPACFDVSTAGAVAAEIQDRLVLGALTLDASAVTRVDAAALQLLCATFAAARASSARVEWRTAAPAVIEGARILALSEALGLPRARPLENR
jgi:anti-anti-sigma regulatory factor